MGNPGRTSRNPDSTRLIGAVALSVSIHLLLGAAWIIHPPRLNPSDNPNKAQPIIRFGIDQSQHQTIAWLGFIDPTPNEAALSTIDQSALSPEVAQPSQSARPAAPASAAVMRRAIEAQAVAQASLGRWLSQGQFTVIQLLESAVQAAQDPQPQQAGQQPADPAQPQENASESSETTPNEPTPAESTPPADPVPPAIESPKESDAASRDKPLEYHNGKVASREGLDIKTVKPKWTDSTLLTANPRNPLVRVEFGSDGKVKRATFEGTGSGDEAVDQTLLNAIYAWTATGVEIDDLKATDPKGVVAARIRIRLR
jgi:hypothetical protein